MRPSTFYREVTSLIDAADVTIVCREESVDGELQYRAQANLRGQIGNGITLVQSGWWYSRKGAERELLRMLRGVRLESSDE